MVPLLTKPMYHHFPYQSSSHHVSHQEIFWFAGLGKKVTSEDITADKVGMQVKEKNCPELVTALTADGAPLASGALPSCGGATAESDKAMWDGVLKTTTVKQKREKTPKNTEGDECKEMVPKTMKEKPGSNFIYLERFLFEGAKRLWWPQISVG